MLLKNILLRYVAENFPIILKELPCRTHVGNSLWWSPFLMKFARINSRLATLKKKVLHQGGLPVNILELSPLLHEGLT